MKIRSLHLESRLKQYAEKYQANHGNVADQQLELLNSSWQSSLKLSSWARSQREQLQLPDTFESWEAFKRLVPVQRKIDIRRLQQVSMNAANVQWRSTGGTTAEPIRFPVFKSESNFAALDLWLGRGRLGVRPEDRLFMIWGHGHLFGTGFGGALARLRRRAADWALGYTRWSAYKLSPEDLHQAARALQKSRAKYVIAYSSALDRFARANIERKKEIHAMNLKVVIATAEGFPKSDSREIIAECFGCPVVMEYGSVETGPMAYERIAGGYDVFWLHHRLEMVSDSAKNASPELVVTSLYPRAMPLLRYAVGDSVIPCKNTDECITEFESVSGRCNDAVVLPDGLVIHSEAFTHVLRDLPGIHAYQIVQREGLLPLIRYEADHALSQETCELIRQRMAKVDNQLSGISIERTDRIEPTVAGKHRMVVKEN